MTPDIGSWEVYPNSHHAMSGVSMLGSGGVPTEEQLPLKLPLFELNKTKKDPYKHHSGEIRISNRINGFRHLRTACIRLKIRRGLSPRGGSTPPPGTKKYLLQNVFSSSGGGLSRKEPPRRAAPRKSAAASVISLTSGAVPQRCRGCQNRTAGCCWARGPGDHNWCRKWCRSA